jgi:hypothetical protein
VLELGLDLSLIKVIKSDGVKIGVGVRVRVPLHEVLGLGL